MRLALALSLLLAGASANAQVRHRRPVAASPDIRYGYDNNTGTGCRDYNCGSRCYDGHSGTDISVPVGSDVLASADGTVTATNNGCANYGYVGNPCGGRCGNYVQLRHDDGSVTIFCHMQLNSIRVSRGQRVRCGQVMGRSASSGSSSGPHLHFGWRRSASSASLDSFRGRCSNGPGVWTDQSPYPRIPGAGCACVPQPETCNGRDDDCDGRVDDGVCAMDAGARPDAATAPDVARTDVPRTDVPRTDVPRTDAGNPDAGRTDAGFGDIQAPDVFIEDSGARDDATAEPDDAGFEDVGPSDDADEVSPDRMDPVEGGCGCRATGRSAQGGALIAVGLASLVMRRRGRRRA